MNNYLMENKEEARRLTVKTDKSVLVRQAVWAGIRPGMRVADIGCGAGVTSSYLYDLVWPGGAVTGVDASPERIDHARKHYGKEGLDFVCHDFYQDLKGLGSFDFIWVRFVLEYHRAGSFDIVRRLTETLKPGGILCLIDLDYNCLSYFGLSKRLEDNIRGVMKTLEENSNFDPFVGRKLYSYLYDLGFEAIDVQLKPHHLFFGQVNETDRFNWMKKLEVAARNSGWKFEGYADGFDGFFREFEIFFADPRRFIYTPMISCRGCRPKIQAL